MSEELQRYLKKNGKKTFYKGDKLGNYDHFILGNTTLKQLEESKIIKGFIVDIPFKPKLWDGKPTVSSKPDEIILDSNQIIAVVERKTIQELNSQKKEETAVEQCLVYMQQLGAKIGIITDYNKFIWIHDLSDRHEEINYIFDGDYPYSEDYRFASIIPNVLKHLDVRTNILLHEEAIDPSTLADSVWQTIWLATHEEPKPCLSTFVELFIYKFISDLGLIPDDLSINSLNCEETAFIKKKGKTQIEFYAEQIRPKMKSLFPEKDPEGYPIEMLLGSDVTSIIDGFVFLEPGITTHNHPLSSFNHSFLSIIKSFVDFGKISKIDTEFKSRVYEKFLKKNVKQQKLGQYLTPRNVVRAIVAMANIRTLLQIDGASICDPACGVGGFILEPLLHEESLKNNLSITDDTLTWKVELVGLEVDRQTNILSKANMLIHMAEDYINLPKKQKESFTNLMHRTFVLIDHDKMLGSLEFPQSERFNLIMTNPPFVVKGTKNITEKINKDEKLKDNYTNIGLGVESYFIRWIVDALKPGGRGFIIVPTGILTRSGVFVREYIEKKCFIDGIIYLPERTFYNTTNVTYILCITKKHSDKEIQKSPVFAYLVREIGETRDALRFPCRSDLQDCTRQFRAFYADKDVFEKRNLNCKIIEKNKLPPADRWDIDRFWTEEEKRELGLSEEISAMTLTEFENLVDMVFTSIKDEIKQLSEE